MVSSQKSGADLKTTALVLGAFLAFSCCLLLVCGAAVAAYFLAAPRQPDAAPVESPSGSALPTETPAADCSELMSNIIREALGGSVYGPAGTGGSEDREPDDYYLVYYNVSGDEISDPSFETVPDEFLDEQDDTAAQESAWQFFSGLIPLEDRSMVGEYVIFSDGPRNRLAAVEQTRDDPAQWALEVDIADVENRYELAFTLAHEYGHLLTLSPSQVPPDQELFDHPNSRRLYEQKDAACTTYFTGEGCSLPDSYINTFFERYWAGFYDEWRLIDELSDQDDQSEYYDQLFAFYKAHEDQFIDDYAATNAAEDLAETFAYFVFAPVPGGDTIADEKVRFFRDYPELAALRERIRRNTCATMQ